MSDLMRHVSACRNAVLPGGRLPLRLDSVPAGWVSPKLAAALVRLGAALGDDGVVLPAA